MTRGRPADDPARTMGASVLGFIGRAFVWMIALLACLQAMGHPIGPTGIGQIGEITMHPGTPVATKQSINPLPTAWTTLKVRITGPDQVYCSYTWATGHASDSTNIGAKGIAFGFTAPAA
jgi:hypothetical protein